MTHSSAGSRNQSGYPYTTCRPHGPVAWLQTYTPDENTTKDGKGDGMLSNLSSTIGALR